MLASCAAPPPLPTVPTDNLSPASRDAIESARRNASQNPGPYGQVLHAYGLYEYALDAYRRAEAADPNNADWPYYQALALDKLNRSDASRHKLQRALDLKPDLVPAELRMAENLLAAGQPRKALDYLVRATSQEPRNARAHFLLGRTHQALYDLPAAIGEWQQALEFVPNYADAHKAMADAYRSLNQDRLTRLHAAEAVAPEAANPADEYEVRLRYLRR